jgi:anti-sigma regulatory factor (Ser/Thr protein kinase)
MRITTRESILDLFRDRLLIQNREVAQKLGITRQGAHKHLKSLVNEGVLKLEGKGRGAKYRLISSGHLSTYPTKGLEEDAVWDDLLRCSPDVAALPENARSLFQYALTELVNNAVDHSGSQVVEVEVNSEGTAGKDRLALVVTDRGVGIFEHVRQHLGLTSDLEALQELSKGKTTTMPSRHTGEGLFFVSKAADCFEVQSGRLHWIVDNAAEDVAALEVDDPRIGTRVCFEVSPTTTCDLRQVFEAYTRDYEFVRTRTVIKLFTIGVRFVSRSEAKRLVHGLERFQEVVMDFRGVEGVGQGFADEVFRVWHSDHPEVRLVPVNMSDTVEFMVKRAHTPATSSPG